MWTQAKLILKPRPRGFHLVTDEIVAQLSKMGHVQCGLLHLFIQHTSASISINENADPTVRSDLERHFNHFVPENQSYYQHDYEGSDDMPAHIKSVTIGNSLKIPITAGRLNMGCWQGIYLCEHRNSASSRTLIATIHGQND